MIAQLKGVVVDKDFPWVTLDVMGVGYAVEVPLSTFESLFLQREMVLLTEMVVREDAMLLYGFASTPEKSLFKLLVKVNGVGPKLALAILSSLSVVAFVQAVAEKNLNALVKIPGVGKKTAERLLLELAGSMVSFSATFTPQLATAVDVPSDGNVDSVLRQQVTQALESLGYSSQESYQRANKAWLDGLSLSELIKRALQVTG